MKRSYPMAVLVIAVMIMTATANAGENESIRVLQKKAYPLNMKLELSAGGGISVADRYTKAVPFGGGLYFHPWDFISFGSFFLYTLSSETKLSQDLRSEYGKGAYEPERTRTKWLAGGEVVVYPIYGKLSVLSEVVFNYHIYLSGGGGAADITVDDYSRSKEKSYGIRPVYTIAGGMQIHLFRFGANKDKYVDLKIEARYFGYTVAADKELLETTWFNAEQSEEKAHIPNSAQHRLVLSMGYISVLF